MLELAAIGRFLEGPNWLLQDALLSPKLSTPGRLLLHANYLPWDAL